MGGMLTILPGAEAPTRLHSIPAWRLRFRRPPLGYRLPDERLSQGDVAHTVPSGGKQMSSAGYRGNREDL